MRQPDIEIYLKDADRDAVSQWLRDVFGSLQEWQQNGQAATSTAGDIEVTWYPRAVGKWSSLFFASDATPWASDLDCARDAFAALAVEIRCAPGGWVEDQEADPDMWLKVNGEGVQEFLWRTA